MKRKTENSNYVTRIKGIAETFNKAMSYLLLKDPKSFSIFFQSEDEIPNVYRLSDMMKDNYEVWTDSKIRYISSIIFLLNAINKDEAIAIYKTFFIKRDADWWKDKYSKSGYYRLRDKALESFFTIVDNKSF